MSAGPVNQVVTASPTPEGYYDWLARGRALSESHSNNSWNIGDWLIEGDGLYNLENYISKSDRYLLIHKKKSGEGGCYSEKIPNYWKDAAAETGNAVSTLKEMAKVARAYASDTRLKELSYSHHKAVVAYDRRLEYLAACLNVEPGERIRSVGWLQDYAARNEGEPEIHNFKACHVRFLVSEEMWEKLKQLSHYYKTNICDLVQKDCTAALEAFLAAQARKISLAKFDSYEEGQWPFYKDSQFNKRERKKAEALGKQRRNRKRADHKPEVRAHGRAMAISRWSRNERVE